MNWYRIFPGRELHPKERIAILEQEVRDRNFLGGSGEEREYEPLLRHALNTSERKHLETLILENPDPAEARRQYYIKRVTTGRCRRRKLRYTDPVMSQPRAQSILHNDEDYYGLYWRHKHEVQWKLTCFLSLFPVRTQYIQKCQGCAKWQEHRRLCDQEWLEFVRQVKDKHSDSEDSGFAC